MEPGTRLGQYEILSPLGAGGMGAVYRAKDTKLKRDVAIKVLPDGVVSDATLARFDREAEILAGLNHPNIATIHGLEEHDGRPCLILELVEGETLAERLREGPLSLQDAMRINRQIAQALEAAHEKGIIHRDLKPGNVMVTWQGAVKVLDFGLAKALQHVEEGDLTHAATKASDLTALGVFLGTAPYMSPEQLRGQALDSRTDIWSFGCVLYETLTGKPAFARETAVDTLNAILEHEPNWSDLPAGTPGSVESLSRRCLQKDRGERLHDIADARIEIDEELSGWSRSTAVAARGLNKKRTVAYSVGALALAATLVIGWQTLWPTTDTSSAPVDAPSSGRIGARVAAAAFDPTDWVIAVLPIVAVAEPDPEIAALNDGLTVTLTAQLAGLSRTHGLQVIPASSLRELRIDTLGKAREELGVSLAINYATRRVGDRDLRVTATLVDGGAQRQLGADTIDGTLDDLIEFEERVAQQVLGMLQVELEPIDRQALSAGTSNPAAYALFLRGQGLLADYDDPDNIESAADFFQQALRLDPTYADAHAALGTAFQRRFTDTREPVWIDRASQQCRRAQELDDQAALAHVCLGELYNSTGEPEIAIAELSRALALDPTIDVAYIELGKAYQELNKPELAEETYRDAIMTRPHYWAGHQWLGIFLLRRGRLDEAIVSLGEVVRLAPASYSGYRNLGTAHYFAENWDEARRLFERALSIRPDDERSLSNLATLYFFERRYADAARTFERAAELDDKNHLRWGNLADAYYWLPGARDRAADTYRRAIALGEAQLRINPRDVDALIDLAFYNAMLEQRDNAIAHIEKALALEASEGYVLLQAAKVYHRLGDDDTALHHLQAAVAAGYTVVEIRAAPVFDDLAGDPRFEALLDPGAR